MLGMVSPNYRQGALGRFRERGGACALIPVIAALVWGGTGWLALGASAASAEQAITKLANPDFDLAPAQAYWRTEVISKDTVQTELANLYLTLSDNKALKTKQAIILPGDTPTDVMIRSGIWPSWLAGRVPLSVDTMLCDLNPEICSARGSAKKPEASDWSKAWPGASITLPDIDIKLSYEVGVRRVSELAKKIDDIAVVETSDLAELWCRKAIATHETCAGGDVLQGWANRAPEIIQYVDDGKIDPKVFSKLASPDALRKFGAADSQVKMVAIPTIETNLQSEPFNQGGYNRALESLAKNIVTDQKLHMQSTAFVHHNRAKLGPMKMINGMGKYRRPWRDGENLKPVTIAHIDSEADLSHCAFAGKVRLMRWNLEDKILEVIKPVMPETETVEPSQPVDGAEAVNASLAADDDEMADTDLAPESAATECGLLNDHPLAEKSHGTHTLGLLVELLSLGGQAQAPQGGLPPITIIHVPNPGGATSTSEPAMKALLEAINLFPWWGVDAVNMSVAWNKAEAGLLEQAIVQDENTIPFIVAAGNYSERSGCSIAPACIESRNVISVVGLDVDPEGQLKLLEQSNAGYRYHDIGAIGSNLVSAVGDGMVGPLSGTSQAAPIIAAVVGHLMRRGVRDVGDIYAQLITTAKLDNSLLDYANATMIDLDRAMNFDVDHVELHDGCKMDGAYDDLDNSTQLQAKWTTGEGGLVFIDKGDFRRFYYNAQLDWHLIMYEKNDRLYRGTYRVVPEHLDRTVRFLPATVSDECGTRVAGHMQKFPLSAVNDLIITSR